MGRRADAYQEVLRHTTLYRGRRMDANETATFARQLEDIDKVLYEVQYPQFKALDLVPVKTDVDPGAEKYVYRYLDHRGQAKIISDYAKDFPEIEIQGAEVLNGIASLGASYKYSLQDMRRAKMASLPLDETKALVVREALARFVDDLVWSGNSDAGLGGFANNSEVDLVSVINGNWDTETDANKILADLLKLEAAPFNATSGIEVPDTLVLPQNLQAKLETTPIGTNSDHSIMDYFRKKASFVRNIEYAWKLNTADAGGTKGRAIVYRRDPTKLCAIVPVEFEQFPPQEVGLTFVINCHARCGGTVVRYPKSMNYMDGIHS